jgi:hypothetical protein
MQRKKAIAFVFFRYAVMRVYFLLQDRLDEQLKAKRPFGIKVLTPLKAALTPTYIWKICWKDVI